MSRIFILSPANCAGKRAQYLINPNARFELAARLNGESAISLAEAFSFMSGLYFRGKWQYARTFTPPDSPVYVITPNRGLVTAQTLFRRSDLVALREGSIHPDNPEYMEPLRRDAERLAFAHESDVVLLGSIATPKYVEVLRHSFGERLLFPIDFAGRGDLSRGGLLLRAAHAGVELEYAPVATGKRHGPKPPRLEKWRI